MHWQLRVWLQQDLIVDSEELRRALHEMIANSNNDATSYILDLLTGTTSGPSLNESNYQAWKIQRQLINNWLDDLRWPEIKIGTAVKRLGMKDLLEGKRFLWKKNENRNSMTTDGSASF